jgi:hypothetical protein
MNIKFIIFRVHTSSSGIVESSVVLTVSSNKDRLRCSTTTTTTTTTKTTKTCQEGGSDRSQSNMSSL